MVAFGRILAVIFTPSPLLRPVSHRTTSTALPPPRDVFPAYVVEFGTTSFVTLDGLAGERGHGGASAEVMPIVEATSGCTQRVTGMAVMAGP